MDSLTVQPIYTVGHGMGKHEGVLHCNVCPVAQLADSVRLL
jgi:hypothetical protein